jgi:hypothetical protein
LGGRCAGSAGWAEAGAILMDIATPITICITNDAILGKHLVLFFNGERRKARIRIGFFDGVEVLFKNQKKGFSQETERSQ